MIAASFPQVRAVPETHLMEGDIMEHFEVFYLGKRAWLTVTSGHIGSRALGLCEGEGA